MLGRDESEAGIILWRDPEVPASQYWVLTIVLSSKFWQPCVACYSLRLARTRRTRCWEEDVTVAENQTRNDIQSQEKLTKLVLEERGENVSRCSPWTGLSPSQLREASAPYLHRETRESGDCQQVQQFQPKWTFLQPSDLSLIVSHYNNSHSVALLVQ